MTIDKPNPVLTTGYALAYAKLGWAVFPVKARDKTPLCKWREESTTDPKQIYEWFRHFPVPNLGVDCGKSGLYVIDCDGQEGIEEWSIIAGAGGLPPLVSQRTGGGGLQIFFSNPSGLHNTAKVLGSHIDTRGDGGYVVLPPSVHPSGNKYTWVNPPETVPLISVPEWLGVPKTYTPQSKTARVESIPHDFKGSGEYWLSKALAKARVGNRNHIGFWLACQLRDDNLSKGEVEMILEKFRISVTLAGNPYTKFETLKTLDEVFSSPGRGRATNRGRYETRKFEPSAR